MELVFVECCLSHVYLTACYFLEELKSLKYMGLLIPEELHSIRVPIYYFSGYTMKYF